MNNHALHFDMNAYLLTPTHQ